MTQDEKWMIRYNELKDFIEANQRNPSRHFVEGRNLLSWLKHQRKLMNKGELKPERVELFKELLALSERYKHKNQYE